MQIGLRSPSLGPSVTCTHDEWLHLTQTAHSIHASLCPGLTHPTMLQSVLWAGDMLIASGS